MAIALSPIRPDVPSDQKEVDEMIKRILKMRWIGNEAAARTLELQLKRQSSADGPSVLAEPNCTD